MKRNKLTAIIVTITLLLHALSGSVIANPYFYIDGVNNAAEDNKTTWSLYLATDNDTITAAQTVINFDEDYFSGTSLSTLNSQCSFWSPADPSLGYGNQATPYFHNSNKAVFACGFSNPGFDSGSSAELIAKFSLTPQATGSASLSFSNSQFRYIGDTITPGASSDFDITIHESTESASEAEEANATPTPSPVPATPQPEPDTLSEDELNFVEISSAGTSGDSSTTTSTDGSTGTLEAVDQDDAIPEPGELEPREPATPRPISNVSDEDTEQNQEGEVLSVSSLRELLIPGKSPADRTVVMVNLITTLVFLILLAIAIWRLITISRTNRVKYTHMQEMLTSELAAIESKMSGIDAKNPKAKEDISQSFESVVEKLKQDKKNKKKS